MAIFSVASCTVFILETYLEDVYNPTLSLFLFWSELLFSTFFAFQYVLGLYLTSKKFA